MEKRVCPSYPTWQLGVVTLYNHFVNSYSKQRKRMCKEIKYLWTDRQTDSETQVQHHNTMHHPHKSSITRLLQDLPAGSRPNMWKQYFTSSYITVYYLHLSILTKNQSSGNVSETNQPNLWGMFSTLTAFFQRWELSFKLSTFCQNDFNENTKIDNSLYTILWYNTKGKRKIKQSVKCAYRP